MSARKSQLPLPEYQIMLAGHGGSGKSSYTFRYIQGEWEFEIDASLEDCYRKEETVDGQRVITDILDCAGGEEYWPTIGMSYLERTTGAIFCFSVNSRPTFDDMGRLHEEMRKRRPDTFPMVMLGLQADMKLDRKVSVGEARALAAKWGCEYFEASAKDDVGVKEPIIHLVRLMRDYYVKYPGKNPKKRLDINVWSDKTPLQQDKRGKRPKILRFFGLFK